MERKKIDSQLSSVSSETNSSVFSFDSEGDELSSQDNSLLPDESEDIVLEAVDQNPYDLTYTCLLLPRLGSHQLSGDVADCIQDVIEQVSASLGWNLNFLHVDPRYLQWGVRVSPSISTTYVIQVFRNQTSLSVFTDFPYLKREQEEDFWAPGYLVFLGAQPHPIEIINRYIRQIRQQQGMWMDE